jgi:DNA-binding GntR family transcriptional regulator
MNPEPRQALRPPTAALAVVPVARDTVQDRVYRQLRARLMQGAFQPGQKLVLQELAAAFGTSTQPVREAVRQLVAEKALEALPNRTARVPALDAARLEDLRQARLALEGLLAERAALRASRADVAELERVVASETEADDARRADVSVAENQAFHFGLYRLAGSAVLPPLVESLWLQVGPYIRLAAEYFDGRDGRGAEFHLAAMKALKRGDPVRVRRAIEADIDRFFDLCRDLADADGSARRARRAARGAA